MKTQVSIEQFLTNPNQIKLTLLQGVYKLSFTGTKNFYIGSTTENFKQRYRRHINDLKKNKHCNIMLQNSFKKYGLPFIEILEVCSKETCIEKEQFYINSLNPKYNIAKIAGNTLGVKMKPEILEKKSIKVDVFDLEGNYVTTFKSITSACKELGSNVSNVIKSMKTECTSSNGYQFREFKKYSKIGKYEKATADKVLVYNIEGIFIKEYKSKLEAAIDLKIDVGGIVKNIQGKYSCVKNYMFKNYEKNYPLKINPYRKTHTNQKCVKITDFYTKEVFKFDSINKITPSICYKNIITKGITEHKGKDFIIKNRYIIQIETHKTNEIVSNE